jgi:quercetin dioxygenase-like cupin family protein
MHSVRTSVVVVFLLAAVAAVYAQTPAKSGAKKPGTPPPPPKTAAHTMMNASDIKWGPAPPAFQPGAQFAVLEGDPAKPGPFVVRVKFPDGYKVMPHWHPTDENVTVISGTLIAGMGEKWEDGAMKTFTAGAFARMPKRAAHYVQAKDETIVQVHGTGPFTLTYVNPNDDPRKKKTQ